MTLNEYFKLANVTLSKAATPELDLLHAKLGMITEPAEALDAFKRAIFYGRDLDVVNLLEEIGDAIWYCHIPLIGTTSSVFDRQSDDWQSEQALPSVASYAGTINALSECINAAATFGLTEVTANFCLFTLARLLRSLGVPLSVVLYANIAKLATRYPADKFEELPANIRELAGERHVLTTYLSEYTAPVLKSLGSKPC